MDLADRLVTVTPSPRLSGPPIPVPPTGAPWFLDGVEFALTYNGYDRHGGQEGASALGRAVHEEFLRSGRLPDDLDTLRCSLFWEQRYIRWNEHVDLLADEAYAAYLQALLDRIRDIGGGTVPGPPDPLP